jgi:hypothetical protein
MSFGIPPVKPRSMVRLLIGPVAVVVTLAASGLWIVFYLGNPQSIWKMVPSDFPVQFTMLHHAVDVTDRLRGEVVDNRLSVVANNNNFSDPAPGVPKKLRVEYSIDSSPGVRTADENETLVIAAAAGKRLEIRRAVYGDLADQKDQIAAGDVGTSVKIVYMDVAKILRDRIRDNALTIKAGNDTMGGDPAFGVAKRLTVEYSVAGKRHTVAVTEGDMLSLPANGDGTGSLEIASATWGPQR